MSERFLPPSRWILAAALLWTLSPAAAPAHADDEREDANEQLETRVRIEILDKFGADGLSVDVATASGHVVLAGTVAKRSTYELLADVVDKVSGVDDVVSHVKLEEKIGLDAEKAAKEGEREVNDAGLRLKVRAALVERLGRDGFRVGIESASGVVSLDFHSKVEPKRRLEAVAIAEQVRGVVKVITIGN